MHGVITMVIILYGIPNCDTVKKARTHLQKKGIDYVFVDFKKQMPDITLLKRWYKDIGDWPVNMRGRTYRLIKDDFENANDAARYELLRQNTSAIKRPLLEVNGTLACLGYDKAVYDSLKPA